MSLSLGATSPFCGDVVAAAEYSTDRCLGMEHQIGLKHLLLQGTARQKTLELVEGSVGHPPDLAVQRSRDVGVIITLGRS